MDTISGIKDYGSTGSIYDIVNQQSSSSEIDRGAEIEEGKGGMKSEGQHEVDCFSPSEEFYEYQEGSGSSRTSCDTQMLKDMATDKQSSLSEKINAYDDVSFAASLPQKIPYVERMTPEDRKNYPEFTSFVSNLKDIEYKDKTVWAAMKKWGSFKSDANIRKALSSKSGPKIRFADFKHSGPAKYDSEKNIIFINKEFAQAFEKHDYRGLKGEQLKLYTEAILLHETVHYGNHFYGGGKYKYEEDGYGFNKEAYGKEVILKSFMNDIFETVKNRREDSERLFLTLML
ncbi:MAG: hypothetical protein AB2L14_18860 [Candidatus Xenobiia bacterium LiM19]